MWREPGDLSCQVTVQALDTNEYVLGSKPHGELFITKFMAKRAARKAMLAACRTPPNERL